MGTQAQHNSTMREQGNLSTLNDDGTRRWLKPRPSEGAMLRRRRAIAYLLITIFAAIPWLRINDKPAVLLNIAAREFTLFGVTYLATDTLLLALVLVTIFLSVFMMTAVFGRLWCGWACPQTVYLEFIFRPLERFFEGTPGKATSTIFTRLGIAGPAKFLAYSVLSFFLANIFLSYFVGTDNLILWVTRPPFEHPFGFTLVVAVAAMMLFDFGFFREQLCIVACPYGRFQSVLLDRDSLIVGYDPARGEPRRVGKSVILPLTQAAPISGDCIDCSMCVTTCPTGIDIRNGLQLECIHCAQCVDACDSVMHKIGKPRGLIRYGSQNEFNGERKSFFRPRLAWYGLLLSALFALTSWWIVSRPPADVLLLNQTGLTFTREQDGSITNHRRIKITNHSERPMSFSITCSDSSVSVRSVLNPFAEARKGIAVPVLINAPASLFERGKAHVTLTISSVDNDYTHDVPVTLQGPADARSTQGKSR
jgi:cytochrome c oxidase accessory protein FixG